MDVVSEHAQHDVALRQSTAGLVGFAQVLLQAAVVAGGKELVSKVEAALQAGGLPMLRVGFLVDGVEVALTVEGHATGPLEVFGASGLKGLNNSGPVH